MKVAIYIRVSTSDQTTLNQELELKKYCENNNYEIFNIYREEGVSGAKTTRPQLDLMLQSMRKREFGKEWYDITIANLDLLWRINFWEC